MVNFKKMDDKDFVFAPTKLSNKQDKAFSEFLKSRKLKNRKKKAAKPISAQ